MSTQSDAFNIQLLHQQSDVQLLDGIDTLRSSGITHLVALPQIVVCGDQSSGKSSVLEAISGIPFPTKDNLCTRFATEVILRRTSVERVAVTIVRDPHKPSSQCYAPSKDFQASLADLSEFGNVLEKAKVSMGLTDGGSAFTGDILRIEISGPNRPHLTIVDLPGLIHSHNKVQSLEDVEVVQALVRRYMTSSRSIILAIVSAKNDYANQIVLKMAREVDPRGIRTLGIITKPDTLPAGSESEAAYLSLAQNQDIVFHLGWHVLKNRDVSSRGDSSQERDDQETVFLSQGAWSQLPRETVAVAALRVRLSKLLLEQIKSELPALTAEIGQKLRDCRDEVRKLGSPRRTNDDQRRFLLHLAQDYQTLATAAIDGIYKDAFFGDPMSESGYNRRIRAVVQNRSLEFAKTMRCKGHRYEIVNDHNSQQKPQAQKLPLKISRDKYIAHVQTLMERTRGRELPGTFNPLLTADLFYEQSSPWADLAQGYLDAVWAAIHRLTEAALKHIAHVDTAEHILEKLVYPALDYRLSKARKIMSEILEPYSTGHPITYNHYFTETIQNVRAKRMEDDLTRRLRAFVGGRDGETLEDLQFAKLKKTALISALSVRNEPDMDQHSCAEAADCMFAYYKVAMKAVVDNIATQCIERHLIRALPNVFSPSVVMDMDDATVERFAQEAPEITQHRDALNIKEGLLETGLSICRLQVASHESPLQEDDIDQSWEVLSPDTKFDTVQSEISEAHLDEITDAFSEKAIPESNRAVEGPVDAVAQVLEASRVVEPKVMKCAGTDDPLGVLSINSKKKKNKSAKNPLVNTSKDVENQK